LSPAGSGTDGRRLQIFGAHGGISPLTSSLHQVNIIRRSIPGYDNAIVYDLMWSDPSGDVLEYERSTHSAGACFGAAAVRDFQKTMKIRHIIRSHHCIQTGVDRFAGDISFTVFTSMLENLSGFYGGIYRETVGTKTSIRIGRTFPTIHGFPRTRGRPQDLFNTPTAAGRIVTLTKSNTIKYKYQVDI
jgi:hypothetical protein